MKEVLIIKNKTTSSGLNIEDITKRLEAKTISYDVQNNENSINNINGYKYCILFGDSSSTSYSDFKNNLCYIPDPDLTSKDLKDMDLTLKELEHKVLQFKARYPSASTFSLFFNEVPENFVFLKPEKNEQIKLFELCLISDDSYKKSLHQILRKVSSIMLIYIGTNNKECEEEINNLWENYPNLGLSTFQEPSSFLHSDLAKEVLIDFESSNFNSEIQILKELKFCDLKITSNREKISQLPFISSSNLLTTT